MTIATYGDPRALPPFDAIVPAAILPALEAAIGEHEAVIERLVADRPARFVAAWLPLEAALDRIEAVWTAATHLHAVADPPELRAAFVAGQAGLTSYMAEVEQNRALYDRLVTLAASPELNPGRRDRVVDTCVVSQ